MPCREEHSIPLRAPTFGRTVPTEGKREGGGAKGREERGVLERVEWGWGGGRALAESSQLMA